MALSGGDFTTLMANMVNQGTNQIQAGARLGQQQQQVDIEKQQEQDRQRQADMEFHQHMTELGATPVYQGMVKDTHQLPSVPSPTGALGTSTGPDMPGPTVTTVRKVDPARFVKVSGADGNSGYELPSYADQIKNQVQAQAPARQAQVQQDQDTSRAQAVGTGQGRTEVDQQARNAVGIPMSPEMADQYGIPPGYKVLPSEMVQLATRYNTVRRAQTMGDAAMDRTKANIDSKAGLQQAQQAFTDAQNKRKLDAQTQWNAARNAIASNTQSSLNNRALLRQFDSNQAQHGKLLDQMNTEGQKQLQAQPLLDPQATPDGTEFSDPWAKKTMTMNYAQRIRLQNSLQASHAQVADWQGRADGIAQRFGLNSTPGGAAPNAGAPGAAAPGTTGAPAGAPSKPAAPAKPQAKVANQAQVQAYAKTKNIPPDQAMKEFKSAGYTVQ